jgi:hypothetical protein
VIQNYQAKERVIFQLYFVKCNEFNELQYAINKYTFHLYIITIFIANLSYNANYPNDIVLTLQCSTLALFIMGNGTLNYKYSRKAIRPESALQVAS